MGYFWRVLYNFIFIPFGYLLFNFLKIFNPKIREGIEGRTQTFGYLREKFSEKRKNVIFWFHSASHGEYEQIRPILKGLKEVLPNSEALVSFFSPSGYKNVKDDLIDYKIYLPYDTGNNMRQLISLVNPQKIIFAEYDIWPNLVWEAKKKRVKTTVFSAHISSQSYKLYPVIRSFYREVYGKMSSIYTDTKDDYQHIQKIIGKTKTPIIRILGNPRYDQVKAKTDVSFESVTPILSRDRRLIAGSVWDADEEIIMAPILKLLQEDSDFSVYWVPHEPNERSVSRIKELFENAGLTVHLFSVQKKSELRNTKILIIDKVGHLSSLYWHGRYAYVGGGFGSGIHNVMEPAIARLPILFGPRHKNSNAAVELLRANGGITINSSEEFYLNMSNLIHDDNRLLSTSQNATNVIQMNLGSSVKVIRGILRD